MTEATLLSVRKKSRLAYERGRLVASAPFALVVGVVFGTLAYVAVGSKSCALLPVTIGTLGLAAFLGGDVLRGARRGMIGGIVTLVLPLTVLRPCCAGMSMAESASCCTMPSCCLGTGMVLGLLLALLLPRVTGSASSTSLWRSAGGMMLGVMGVAALRCGPLFLGEGLGLLGGLAAGVLATSGIRRVLTARQVA